MENLVAKNIQRFPTYDGYAWSASFYLDGKKVGSASDQGHGGEMNINIKTSALNRIKNHAKTLPHFGRDMDLEQDAAMVLEDCAFTTLDLRKTKRALKAKVIAKLDDDIYQWKIPKGMSASPIMAQVRAKYPEAVFLNTMSLVEANAILNPVAA